MCAAKHAATRSVLRMYLSFSEVMLVCQRPHRDAASWHEVCK